MPITQIPDANHKSGFRPTNVMERALGLQFLMEFFNGASIAAVARAHNTDRHRVNRLMKSAASTLISSAQERILSEVFPLMVDVLKRSLAQQMAIADEGKPVDTALVERMLKGLFITEAPQLKTELTREVGGNGEEVEETQTLAGFVAKRVLNPKTVAAVKVLEGEVDNGDKV
jgi:hypothetical protein